MTGHKETFVSVDIEASGPIPGEFSMLSIGACSIDRPDLTFECTLQPISDRADPEALKVSGFSLEALTETGRPPAEAMDAFERWALGLADDGADLVFVGFNAPFDWSFVNYYFHRFLGRNPFGFSALDIKAFYMGAAGTTWREARSSAMSDRLKPRLTGDHNALHDALAQAELFRLARSLRNV